MRRPRAGRPVAPFALLLALTFALAPAPACASTRGASEPAFFVPTGGPGSASAARAPRLAGSASAVRAPGAAAVDTVTGRVEGPNGAAVPEAEVYLVEIDRSVLTDASGRFRITHAPGGSFTLRVSAPGYASWVGKVAGASDHPVVVSLKLNAFQLEPLTVSASRRALSPEDSPLPAVSFGREQLDKGFNVSLAHTLKEVPGVHDLSTGGEIGKPVIRGMSGPRVLVLVNGMRLEDYSWSDEDAPAVDAQMADRVEVIRGPASVLYGSDAMGGVVNVAPAPLPDAWGGRPTMRWSGTLYGAWNNREGGLGLANEGANGSWSWRIRGIGRLAEALHTPNGELDNTGFMAATGEGAVSYRGRWGSLTTRLAHYGGEFKLLEANGPPAGAVEGQDQGPERKLADDRVQLLGRFPKGGMVLETKGQLQRHWLEEVGDVPGQPGVEAPEFELTLVTATGEVLAHHSFDGLGAPIHGTLGLSGTRQGSTSGAGRQIVPDATTHTGGLFLIEQLDRGPFTVMGGARVDVRALYADGHDPLHYTAGSWSIGGVYHASDVVSFSANLGSGWRAPSLFELFADGPRIGDLRYEIGRTDLNPEKNYDIDAGFHLEGSRVRVDLSAYHNFVVDYIYLLPTGQMIDSLQVFRHEQEDARLVGGEGSVEVEVTPMVTLQTHGDLVRGTLATDDSPLPLMPPPSLAGGLNLHRGERYFSAEVEHHWKQTHLTEFDFPTGAYTLLNLGGGFTTDLPGRTVDVDVQVHNAFNKGYRDFLSRYKAFAMNPGRNIVVRFHTRF